MLSGILIRSNQPVNIEDSEGIDGQSKKSSNSVELDIIVEVE